MSGSWVADDVGFYVLRCLDRGLLMMWVADDVGFYVLRCLDRGLLMMWRLMSGSWG